MYLYQAGRYSGARESYKQVKQQHVAPPPTQEKSL